MPTFPPTALPAPRLATPDLSLPLRDIGPPRRLVRQVWRRLRAAGRVDLGVGRDASDVRVGPHLFVERVDAITFRDARGDELERRAHVVAHQRVREEAGSRCGRCSTMAAPQRDRGAILRATLGGAAHVRPDDGGARADGRGPPDSAGCRLLLISNRPVSVVRRAA